MRFAAILALVFAATALRLDKRGGSKSDDSSTEKSGSGKSGGRGKSSSEEDLRALRLRRNLAHRVPPPSPVTSARAVRTQNPRIAAMPRTGSYDELVRMRR